VRELILQLKLGRIRRDWFRHRFDVDVVARFAGPLEDLERRGWLETSEDAVTMTREGLLRVDRLVRAFYLPEHAGIRYS
jgi:coproporphyrinogen III oxidase-like Fe-S oxidoreductase